MTRVTSHRSATPAHITGHCSRTLFVREGGRMSVELRNNVRLLLNVELRNYLISRQIVERRVTSDCYLNIVVSLDC